MSKDTPPQEWNDLTLRAAKGTMADLTAAFDRVMDTPIEEMPDNAGWPLVLQLSEFVLDRTVAIVRTGDEDETRDAAIVVTTSVENRKERLRETDTQLEDPYALAFSRQDAAAMLLGVAWRKDGVAPEAMVLRSHEGAAAAMLREALTYENDTIPRKALLDAVDADNNPDELLLSLEKSGTLSRVDRYATRFKTMLTGQERHRPVHIAEVQALVATHAERYDAQRSGLKKIPYETQSGGESALYRLGEQSFRIETRPDSFSVLWSTETPLDEFRELSELTDARLDTFGSAAADEAEQASFARYEIGDSEDPVIVMTWSKANGDVPADKRSTKYHEIGMMGSGARGRHYLERLLDKTLTPELSAKLEYFSRQLDRFTANA